MLKTVNGMKKYLMILLLGGVILGVSACGTQKESVSVAEVSQLTLGEVKKTIKVNGIVKSTDYDRVITTDLISCQVQDILVEQGEFVKEGQLICVLDTSNVKLKKGQSAEVVSTRDGIVSEVFVVEGMTPADGKIVSITNDKDLCAEIWIDEKDISFVETGISSVITAKEITDVSSRGKISMLSRINEENGFRAIVDIYSAIKFRLGMNVIVSFEASRWDNVLMVDPDYIIDNNGNPFVKCAVKIDNDIYRVEARDIQIIGIGDEYVAVRADDSLQEGDYIVAKYNDFQIDDFVNIKVIEEAEK